MSYIPYEDVATTLVTQNNIFEGEQVFNSPIIQTIGGQKGWNAITVQDFLSRNPSASASFIQFKEKIFLYAFPSNKTRELQTIIVVPHTYAENTKIYPYIDIALNTCRSGKITFGIEYTVAKCCGGSISQTITKFISKNVVASDAYTSLRLELSDLDAIPAGLLEIGANIHLRIFRGDAPTGFVDTYSDYVFVSSVGIHYNVGNLITKNKQPDYNN